MCIRQLFWLMLLLLPLDAAFADWKVSSVEVNPLRLYSTAAGGSYKNFTGGINLSSDSSKYELAVPVAYFRELDNGEDCCSNRVSRIDTQLRRFSNTELSGAYFGGLLRYSRIQGIREGAIEEEAHSRYGIGAVIGYRATTSSKRFYVGINLNIGWYLTDPQPVQQISLFDLFLDTEFDVRQDYFINIEVLKIGFRFR